jgi:hypothetical protein
MSCEPYALALNIHGPNGVYFTPSGQFAKPIAWTQMVAIAAEFFLSTSLPNFNDTLFPATTIFQGFSAELFLKVTAGNQ